MPNGGSLLGCAGDEIYYLKQDMEKLRKRIKALEKGCQAGLKILELMPDGIQVSAKTALQIMEQKVVIKNALSKK